MSAHLSTASYGAPYDPAMVFAFSGYVEGQPQSALARGFALARDHGCVIQAMTQAGFGIVALLSLEELRATISVLQSIRSGDPDAVDQGDLVVSDAMSNARKGIAGVRLPFPLDAQQVYTFTGRTAGDAQLRTGFMVARSPDDVRDYLRSFDFQVDAATSLADLMAFEHELVDVAFDRCDPTGYIDLLAETAQAA